MIGTCRRTAIAAAVLVLLAAITASAASAANPHLVEGFDLPECTLNEAGTTLSCSGTEIAGVGNLNAEATLAATATGTVCQGSR